MHALVCAPSAVSTSDSFSVSNMNSLPVTKWSFEVYVLFDLPGLTLWYEHISIDQPPSICLFWLQILNLRLMLGRSSLTYRVYWRLNTTLSSWAKYHDICSLSVAFRAWTPLADCLIHLRLTPTGSRWAGSLLPICYSSSRPSVLSKSWHRSVANVHKECYKQTLTPSI